MASEATPVPVSAPKAFGGFTLDLGSMKAILSYRFTVLDAYVDVTGIPTFIVAQEPVKEKFQEVIRDLANHNLTARIRKVSDKLVISIFPKPVIPSPRTIINVLLLVATIGTVVAASYSLIFGMDPKLIHALFSNSDLTGQVFLLAVSILGIVVLHETGHVIAARHHKMDATLPYFIPAPPPFPFGTFGAVISLRSPPLNRDQLFDLGFSGPFAGFLATIGVAVFALMTAPLITGPQADALIAANLLSARSWPYTPLLLDVIGRAGFRNVPAGQVLVLTQLAFAAEIGALITFLNILPVWQLDGGHISRATFGEEGHKLMAFAGFAVLFLAQYWGFALLLVLFMVASRRPLTGVEPLDDVSPLSNSRKALFGLSLVMLVLSFVIF